MKPLDLEMWSFFFRNRHSLNAPDGINEAHAHTPQVACYAFKNILIFLFRRELNVIDRPGPFKISASISISSPNTHAASFPSGNDCPWAGGIVCLHLEREAFLVASSPYPSSLVPSNVLKYGGYIWLLNKRLGRMQHTPPLTFIIHPPPLSSSSSPPLSGSIPIYICNALDQCPLFRLKKLALLSLVPQTNTKLFHEHVAAL